MSCFGKIVTLPSGEVVEAAAATTAAAAMMAATNDTPKTAESSRTGTDTSTQSDVRGDLKAEVKAKPTSKPKPCQVVGGVAGPGRFKPHRGPGVWIICRFICGKEVRDIRQDPGIEADCWKATPTYMD